VGDHVVTDACRGVHTCMPWCLRGFVVAPVARLEARSGICHMTLLLCTLRAWEPVQAAKGHRLQKCTSAPCAATYSQYGTPCRPLATAVSRAQRGYALDSGLQRWATQGVILAFI